MGELLANHAQTIFFGTVSSYAPATTPSLKKYRSSDVGKHHKPSRSIGVFFKKNSRMVPSENFLTVHCITIGNPLLCIRESLTMHYIIAYGAMDRLPEIEFVRSRPSIGVDRTIAT